MSEATDRAHALRRPELSPDVESSCSTIAGARAVAGSNVPARRCTDTVTQHHVDLTRARPSSLTLDVPSWDGSDPAGLVLLVRCGPALGECIRLARYLLLLTGRRANVLLT